MTPARQAAQHAWLDYVADLNARTLPNCGWLHVGQLPKLDPDTIALALEAYPDLLDDIVLNGADIAYCLRTDSLLGGREYIADSVMSQLRNAIRRQLLRDLQDVSEDLETDRDLQAAATRGQSLQEYREWQMGMQR